MDTQAKLKQRIVGSVILLFIIFAVILLILSFSSGKTESTPVPDQTILNAAPSESSEAAAPTIAVSSESTQANTAAESMAPPSSEPVPPMISQTPRDVVTTPAITGKVPSQFGQVMSSSTMAEEAVMPSSSVTTKVQPVVKATAKPKPEANVKHHKVTVKATTAKVTTKAKPTAKSIKPGWSVKVGSFSSPLNATKLVEQLHAAGYKVYTVLLFSEQRGVLTQVLVGPEVSKTSASKTLTAIQKKYGLKGILIKK